MARPKYTYALCKKICAIIVTGKSLVSACKSVKIGYSTAKDWLVAHEDFAASYARACEERADYLADEIIGLSDEKPKETLNKAGAKVIDSAWVTNQKNKIDARKWIAAKLKPKKYGDKINLDVKQEDALEKATYDQVTSLLSWVEQERKARSFGEDVKGEA